VSKESHALISIYPAHAEAILAGTKKVELRRRLPALTVGTRLWIYATKPIAAVVGVVTVAEITRAHPRTLWNRHAAVSNLRYSEFMEYFDGTDEGTAISFSSVERVVPIDIESLRTLRDGFHPPQVVLKFTAREAFELGRLSKASTRIAGGSSQFELLA
jgi:predicted transcriptional regulator